LSVLNIGDRALRSCFRLYEWSKTFQARIRVRNWGYSSSNLPDGFPLPPAALRVQVAGTADIASFLNGGQLAAQTVRDLLAASGRPMERCGTVLDFGCGCGRVLRQWKDLGATTLYGTDLNGNLVEWCREHLPFASVSLNSAEPPLPFAGELFDAIYAFSVITHMPADLQKLWLREFRRVLKPGGLLLFSTHGSYYAPRLKSDERRQFLSGNLVVRFASAAGSNLCGAYHPEAFVRQELASGWEIASFTPEGARGNPRQDAWVFRRPSTDSR
jgi:SAM-dependent methyltransferase